MKVTVIGGGPGGLYFALLAKKAWPRWEITVYERNRPDDTFGFGVVFSDQTLDSFKAYDLATYERERDLITAPGPVVIKGRDLDVHAQGMEVDVTPQRIRLLDAVHTVLRSHAEKS